MDLKIKDVAELLHVPESTIRRWLADEKIPAYRINGEFRFNRAEIEDWVIHNQQGTQADIVPFSLDPSQESSPSGNKQFSLFRALYKGRVLLSVSGNSKEQVITSTVKNIAHDLNLDADVLTEMLLDRERLQPTALGNGIGIPHTRDFLLSAHHDVVTVVYPEQPLDYGALDGQPVHTLFFLFACDDRHHLNLLAKIAHLSNQPATLEFLRSKPNKEKLLDFVKAWESRVR